MYNTKSVNPRIILTAEPDNYMPILSSPLSSTSTTSTHPATVTGTISGNTAVNFPGQISNLLTFVFSAHQRSYVSLLPMIYFVRVGSYIFLLQNAIIHTRPSPSQPTSSAAVPFRHTRVSKSSNWLKSAKIYKF